MPERPVADAERRARRGPDEPERIGRFHPQHQIHRAPPRRAHRRAQLIDCRLVQTEPVASNRQLPIQTGNVANCPDAATGRYLEHPVVATGEVRGAPQPRVEHRSRRQRARPRERREHPPRSGLAAQQLREAERVEASHSSLRHVVGQADVELEPERLCDLVLEVRAEAPPGGVDAPDQLPLVPADREHVVAVPVARCPGGRLGGERGGETAAVADRRRIETGGDRRQARLMRKQLPNRDVLLAVLGELRPVAGDRCLVVDQAARPCQRHDRRRDALGGREHHHERVVNPWQAMSSVGEATPQVDHLASLVVDAARRADLAALSEVARELVADQAEALVALPLHRSLPALWRDRLSHTASIACPPAAA